MHSHSPCDQFSSKPVAQARESAIRECPFLEPFFRARFTHARPAFTLVELLVVIVILAMLASLVTVAASRAMTAARNAAIKAEIDMLHMAIMNYKNEYGSFPPCVAGSSGRDATHLVRLFPRINAATANSQLAIASTGTDGTTTDSSCLNSIASLNPRTALTFWLGGFTTNPVSPLAPASDRRSLYSFDSARKQSNTSNRFTGEYYSSGKPESQYWYMDSTSSVAELAAFDFARETHPTTGVVFNQDTFQIVNPGRDGVWNNDDDLSNFWPGTRKDFRDSLNQ
jgi:prepilin-type N-terminal cleavage/methylation domain-containing protein